MIMTMFPAETAEAEVGGTPEAEAGETVIGGIPETEAELLLSAETAVQL